MNNASKPAAVPGQSKGAAKGKAIRQYKEGSRRSILDHLEVGESVIFLVEPGDRPSKIQAAITALYRDGESVSQQGLEQGSGLLVFEGELPVHVVRVTRAHAPK